MEMNVNCIYVRAMQQSSQVGTLISKELTDFPWIDQLYLYVTNDCLSKMSEAMCSYQTIVYTS